ncbi:50S ribosomal protein L1 [Bienertia sinuspersici]
MAALKMAAIASSSASFSLISSQPPSSRLSLPFSLLKLTTSTSVLSRRCRTLVIAASSSSSSSFEDFDSSDSSKSRSKTPILLDLIQDIEPLDISLIQKDVPPATIDAMKRTISGMLGLLPSKQFQILIEASWEPLSRLLVSSMMTGYTLRNAEYRLCLEKNLGIHEDYRESQKSEALNFGVQELLLDSVRRIQISGGNAVSSRGEEIAESQSEDFSNQELGEMTPEIQSYIRHLRSHLLATKKELREVKRKNAALQMQQLVGEEKNELLDYLRSLQPEKVAELSEPTSAEVKETIHSVVHGLLATLSPKMHSKAPPLSEKNAAGALNVGNEDCAEVIENTSLNFQPIISLTRDYLARLLFWCMLLGHHLRGLEYRTQLMELLSLSPNLAW